MRTNIEIDGDLMTQAMAALGTGTKRETVDKALREIVRREKQLQAWDALRGTGWTGDLEDMRTSKHIAVE